LFSEAIDHFRTAMALDPSAVTLKDVEQLANLLSRQALARQAEESTLVKQSDKARRTLVAEAEADIDAGTRLLKWLIETPSWRRDGTDKMKGAATSEAPGKTAERLALLGSAYKRKAWVSAKPGAALEQMKHAYEKASTLAEKGAGSALYPRLNQLFAEVILSWNSKRKRQRSKAALRTELVNLKSELAEQSRAKESFWDEVMVHDSELALALLKGTLKGPTIEALAERYREARRRASRREFASVLDQFEFLENMALKLSRKDIAGSLDRLGKALQPKAEGTETQNTQT
jgi:hypothetical protein